MSRKSAPNKSHRPPGVKPRETIVICAKREDPFARIPKTTLDDRSLSGLSKWILSYLIAKPAGWKLRVRDICNHCTDGESAVRARLMELRRAGYVELVAIRDAGRVVEWVWKASDSPIFKPGNSPDVVIPHVENHHLSKNESYSLEFEGPHPTWCDCSICGDRNVISLR